MGLTIYLVLFCRIALGWAFSLSAISKTLEMKSFEESVANFKVLPQKLNKPAAYVFVGGEAVTVVFLALGNRFLPIGFILVVFLMLLFSAALVVALLRKMRITCNCFGPTQNTISIYDVLRNSGFILCAFIGLISLAIPAENQYLTIWDVTPVVVEAVVLVTIWINLTDIAWLFRLSR